MENFELLNITVTKNFPIFSKFFEKFPLGKNSRKFFSRKFPVGKNSRKKPGKPRNRVSRFPDLDQAWSGWAHRHTDRHYGKWENSKSVKILDIRTYRCTDRLLDIRTDNTIGRKIAFFDFFSLKNPIFMCFFSDFQSHRHTDLQTDIWLKIGKTGHPDAQNYR